MAPELPLGQNSGLFRKADLEEVNLNPLTRLALRYMLFNGLTRPDFIGYQLEGISTLPVAIRRKLGVPVLAWTVRSKEETIAARRYADNVFFEGFIPDDPEDSSRPAAAM